jgi:RecT family
MEARKSNTRLLSLAASLARKSGSVMAAEAAIEMVRWALSADAGGATVSDADLTAALELADRNGMNPLAGDIRLYPSRDGLSLNPSVTIDGWIRVINAHPQIDGVEFGASNDRVMVNGRMAHEWIECSIHRKDRRYPTTVREYLDDCIDHMDQAWQMPNRMLRHRSLVQCARIALGLSCGLDDAGKTAAPAVHEAAVEPVKMVHIDAGNAVQTVSTESVAGAPDQTTGRPRRAAARKTQPTAPPVEGVVLEAQESLLPEVAPSPEPKPDGTPTASPAAVKRLALKVESTFDAAGLAELLALAGVKGIRDGMTEGDVARVISAFDNLLSGGA